MRPLPLFLAVLLAAISFPVAPAEPAPEAWGRLEASVSGDGGSFALVYHPFPQPVASVHYRMEYNLTVKAGDDAGAVLHVLPTLAVTDGSALWFPRASLTRLEPGSPVEWKDAWDASASLGEGKYSFAGIAFFVASTEPWSLELTFTRDPQGPAVRPGFLSQGSGVTLFETSGQMAAEIVGPGTNAQLEARLDTPGWTHVVLLAEELQPTTVRSYDLRFPNGFTYQRMAVQPGVDIGLAGYAGCPCYSPLPIRIAPDGAGTMRNSPGDLFAWVMYAEPALNVTLVALHVPMADGDFPHGLVRYDYEAYGEVFDDVVGTAVRREVDRGAGAWNDIVDQVLP